MYLDNLDLSEKQKYELYQELKNKYKKVSSTKEVFIFDKVIEKDNSIVFYDSENKRELITYDYINEKFYLLGVEDYPKSWVKKFDDVSWNNVSCDNERLELFARTLFSSFFYNGEGYRDYRYIEGFLSQVQKVALVEKLSHFPHLIKKQDYSSWKTLWRYVKQREDTSSKKIHNYLTIPKELWNAIKNPREVSFSISNIVAYCHDFDLRDSDDLLSFFILILQQDIYDYSLKRILRLYKDSYSVLESFYQNRLVEYITEDAKRQGISDPHEALELLRDYTKMCLDLELKKYEKYPKYLKTMHDVVLMNYKYKEDEIKTNKFKARYDDNKHLAYSEKNKFMVLLPEEPQDMVKEGSSLSHCISSYIDDVVKGKKLVLFMRKNPSESLLTLEIINNSLLNAKGFGNRYPGAKEKEFLLSYCKEKQLEPSFLRYWQNYGR